MVPRLGRFQGLKVPRLEGGRVWRVANSESSRVAGNPPRVGGFQGWIVSRLDSWKNSWWVQGLELAFQGLNMLECSKISKVERSRVGGFQGVRVGVLGLGGFHGSSC